MKKKLKQHYYPTHLVVADAALLAAKSKGFALSLTLSLRLFREKSRFATNFSRYTSLAGKLNPLKDAVILKRSECAATAKGSLPGFSVPGPQTCLRAGQKKEKKKISYSFTTPQLSMP